MQNGIFKTVDGMSLYTMDAPLMGAKAIVYIVHGIREHIARYTHVAQYLNGRGYAVFGHDHRGHGRSDGERALFRARRRSGGRPWRCRGPAARSSPWP